MRIYLSSRRLFGGAAVGAAVLAAGVVACGSDGSSVQKPEGLSGDQAGSYVNSQYTVEDRAAATLLKPEPGSFLAGKTTVTLVNSTTPLNGDVNPYAIWPVTETVGSVTAGDVLVDNFNNKSNNQGTGTTIVDVHPNGQVGVFASLPGTVSGCPGGVGLTTAMVQLKTGWVIVGSLPSTDGKIGTSGAGCLLVLSPTGKLAGTISEQHVPVWYYRFSYVAQSIKGAHGADHASDIPYFLDTVSIKYGDRTTLRDRAAGSIVSAYLVNFVKTGNPNVQGLPAWKPYARANDAMMDFSPEGTAVPGPDPWVRGGESTEARPGRSMREDHRMDHNRPHR